MKIIYSDESAFEKKEETSIFLAGPTPRRQDVLSWRPMALNILSKIGFNGTVLVPERKDKVVKLTYEDQVEWERSGLTNASCIVVWVPRNIETMPAFTTNVEFGYWLARSPEKIIYGRPTDAPNTRYLDWLYHKDTNKVPTNSLEEVLKEAVNFLI